MVYICDVSRWVWMVWTDVFFAYEIMIFVSSVVDVWFCVMSGIAFLFDIVESCWILFVDIVDFFHVRCVG